MHPLSYRGCWHRVSRCFLLRYRQKFRPSEQKFTPRKGFILHAVSLRQAFAHCGRFLTAASRRSMDRVSVPFWLIILSDQLPVIGLVSRYLTNNLIGRRPLPNRRSFTLTRPSGISPAFAGLSPSFGKVSYVLLTRLPLNYKTLAGSVAPFNLHVLSTPPAFTLSQDQTLHNFITKLAV